MGAVFPKGIKSFVRHRNLLDDVKAEHVNAIQDEIVAIESSLGPLITQVSEHAAEIEELWEEQIGDNKTEQVFITNFANLGDRLTYIEQGRHIPAVELRANLNQRIPRWGNPDPGAAVWDRAARIQFPKPSAAHDPKSLFNGQGITLRTGGFWQIMGHVYFATDNTKGSQNHGVYTAHFGINGENASRGLDREMNDATGGSTENVFLNPNMLGWFPAGTRITLHASQTSQITQNAAFAWLHAVRLRGF